MAYEIWGVDRGAGEAVIRSDEDWYFLSIHERWKPLPTEPEEVLARSHRSRLVPIGTEHATLVEAVLLVRALCAEDLGLESLGVEEIKDLWVENGWFGPTIEAYCGPLDRYFELHGCSREVSFQLSLEALSQISHWRFEMEEEVAFNLFATAQDLCRQQRDLVEPKPQPPPGVLRALDERTLKQRLTLLSRDELSCLRLWAEPTYSRADLALLLKVSRNEVGNLLSKAAEKLGRPVEQLRGSWFAEIFQWEILLRLEVRSWQ